jgi:hypothetical protein
MRILVVVLELTGRRNYVAINEAAYGFNNFTVKCIIHQGKNPLRNRRQNARCAIGRQNFDSDNSAI